MIRRRGSKTDKADDMQLRSFLKRHDPVAPPPATELAALEERIMAQIDALPDTSAFPDVQLSPWMLSKQWLLGGAAAGMLFVVLGFGVGRNFDDLFSQPADSVSLFASADNTQWPSFIVAPSSTGDNDDNAE